MHSISLSTGSCLHKPFHVLFHCVETRTGAFGFFYFCFAVTNQGYLFCKVGFCVAPLCALQMCLTWCVGLVSCQNLCTFFSKLTDDSHRNFLSFLFYFNWMRNVSIQTVERFIINFNLQRFFYFLFSGVFS